jgi:hypothetical protein
MKCRAVYAWLLESREVAALPAEVQRHLHTCAECAHRLQQLDRLDEEVKGLSFPPETPGVRERFLAQLPPRTQASPATSLLRPSPRGLVSWRALALTAAACLLLGLALGRVLGPRQAAPRERSANSKQIAKDRPDHKVPDAPLVLDIKEKEHRPTPGAVVPRPDDLVSRVVRHDVRLAGAIAPGDKVRVLSDLADDLQDDALRSVQRGGFEELPLVANLHEQVVRGGLTRRAAALSVGDRPQVLPDIQNRLRASAHKLRQAAEDVQPTIGDFLRAMGTACAEAATMLEKKEAAPAQAPLPSKSLASSQNLLASLVYGGLDLAELDDPLRRADRCTDVADALVQSIVLAGDSEQASRLGNHLGTVLDRGVADNLASAAMVAGDEKRRAELERIRDRAERATAALEDNLERAPALARKALERALEASEQGRERAAAAGAKGKGKLKPRDKSPKKGKPKGPNPLPPGQMKKLLDQGNS